MILFILSIWCNEYSNLFKYESKSHTNLKILTIVGYICSLINFVSIYVYTITFLIEKIFY
jgi:hypothetical protein